MKQYKDDDMDLIQDALLNKKDNRVSTWKIALPWVVVWVIIFATCIPWGER
jgi:hypothetical protein